MKKLVTQLVEQFHQEQKGKPFYLPAGLTELYELIQELE